MTYDPIDTNDDGVVDADVDNQSVNTEQLQSKEQNSYRVNSGDFSTIQNSIDYAVSEGVGRVEIPAGTYNESITIPDAITVVGTSPTTSGSPGVRIEQPITLDGTLPSVESLRANAGIEIVSGDGARVSNCLFNNTVNIGTGGDTVQFAVINGNDANGEDITLGSNSVQCVVDTNSVTGTITDNGTNNVVGDNS